MKDAFSWLQNEYTIIISGICLVAAAFWSAFGIDNLQLLKFSFSILCFLNGILLLIFVKNFGHVIGLSE